MHMPSSLYVACTDCGHWCAAAVCRPTTVALVDMQQLAARVQQWQQRQLLVPQPAAGASGPVVSTCVDGSMVTGGLLKGKLLKAIVCPLP